MTTVTNYRSLHPETGFAMTVCREGKGAAWRSAFPLPPPDVIARRLCDEAISHFIRA